ncbi:MAG TPA: hypothetical protein VHD56_15915 [Tepidisphaeraceae bacterium]|nr:hypothetical protein [Tepidisphaeraceae bacterium]
MSDLLFETPWWLPTFCIVAGVFIWWVGNNRQDNSSKRIGLSVLLAGVLIALVSYLVETPREHAVRRTRELAAAADTHNWTRFQSLLDPQTSFYGITGPEAITKAAQNVSDQYSLRSVKITGLETEKAASIIKVSIRVFTEIGAQSGVSDWQLQYQNLGEGWKLYSVAALTNEQISEEQIRQRIGR